MHLTIIPSDSTVYRDHEGLTCNLSGLGIPETLHAFQWNGSRGEIEFVIDADGQKPANERVQELPAWALECDAQYAQVKMEQIELAVQQALAVQKAEAAKNAQTPSV